MLGQAGGTDSRGSGGKGEPPANGILPYLSLIGTVKVTGQPTAITGDAVEVYGKGSFKATVKVTETRGQVSISATQKAEKGEELRDERTLVVLAPEWDEE